MIINKNSSNQLLIPFPITQLEQKRKLFKKKIITYREYQGFNNPSKGQTIRIRHMKGLNWYLLWEECPDLENVIMGWFNTKTEAIEYAKKHNWNVR